MKTDTTVPKNTNWNVILLLLHCTVGLITLNLYYPWHVIPCIFFLFMSLYTRAGDLRLETRTRVTKMGTWDSPAVRLDLLKAWMLWDSSLFGDLEVFATAGKHCIIISARFTLSGHTVVMPLWLKVVAYFIKFHNWTGTGLLPSNTNIPAH